MTLNEKKHVWYPSLSPNINGEPEKGKETNTLYVWKQYIYIYTYITRAQRIWSNFIIKCWTVQGIYHLGAPFVESLPSEKTFASLYIELMIW